MRYYPVMLNLKNKNILLVGMGKVGFRKLKGLFGTQANITVITEQMKLTDKDMKAAIRERFGEKEDIALLMEDFFYRLKIVNKPFSMSEHKELLDQSEMIFLCTDSTALHKEIKKYTQEKKIWTLCCDRGDRSDFINPLTTEKDELVISVSTSGSSPTFAKKIKEELEQFLKTIDTSSLKTWKKNRRKL